MNRRSFLRIAAGTSLAAGALGTAVWIRRRDDDAATTPPADDPTRTAADVRNRSRFDGAELTDRDRVYDISEGDLIDPYLEEGLTDGTRLLVPGGRYRWHGSGFGELADAALVGMGEVVLDVPEGTTVYENVVARSGTVLIKNVTQTGAVDGSKDSRIAAWAEEGAKLVFENFDRPDGQVGDGHGGAPAGFFTPPKHAGEMVYRNCHVEGFGNNGLYASTPQKERKGRVVVEGGLYKNNNIAGVRVGSDDSVVRNVTIVQDGSIPTGPNGGRNARGLWVRTGGENVTIENVDVTLTDDANGSSMAVGIHPRDARGSGTVRNCRIWNGRPVSPVKIADSVATNWSGSDLQLTGSGNLDPEDPVDEWVSCTGTGCRPPTRDRQWVGDPPD